MYLEFDNGLMRSLRYDIRRTGAQGNSGIYHLSLTSRLLSASDGIPARQPGCRPRSHTKYCPFEKSVISGCATTSCAISVRLIQPLLVALGVLEKSIRDIASNKSDLTGDRRELYS